MLVLSARLLQLLAASLDEPASGLAGDVTPAIGVLRMLKYTPQPAGAPQAGARAHTDRGALTVLAQDSHLGLELLTREGRWAPVLPRAGALLLHPGEGLRAWSAGRYGALPHRVRRSPGHTAARLSLPFFYTPLAG
jgi:isopenicillin N synthase-like dioxygenase